jgi:hypothetical protein
MPNAVNYNVSAQTQALKKGNFWIATGDVGKGAGYWNGISPPLSGYTIYLNKASNGPAIYTVSTEAQLTGLTSTIAGQTLTTSGACLDWFATQTDKMILNKDYNNIVTNGLVLNLDAGFTPSYPTTGTTWYDLGTNGSNGTFINGPTFNSANDGSILFDGTDDYVSCGNLSTLNNMTIQMVVKVLSNNSGFRGFAAAVGNSSDFNSGFVIQMYGNSGTSFDTFNVEGGFLVNHLGTNLMTSSVAFGTWVNVCLTISPTYVQFYLNGVAQSGTTRLNNGSSTIGMNNLVIGARVYSLPSTSINANIANVQIYNRALSISEVQQNYFATINPKFIFGSNLKIWYDMSLQPSEASVDNVNTIDSSNNLLTLSRVYDLSGNGKHLLQTTKVNQPTFIPNAQNGRPANYNTGGNWYDADATVMYSPYPGLTTGARSFFIVLKGTPWSAFSWDRGGGIPGSLQLGYNGIIGWNDLGQDIGGIGIGGGNATTTYIMSYLFDTTQTLMYRNGSSNRAQTSNTFTLNGGSFGCWTTAPSAGNQEGYWYEMVFLNKIPTIAEYNALVTYLGTKWGVSYGTLTNYN